MYRCYDITVKDYIISVTARTRGEHGHTMDFMVICAMITVIPQITVIMTMASYSYQGHHERQRITNMKIIEPIQAITDMLLAAIKALIASQPNRL